MCVCARAATRLALRMLRPPAPSPSSSAGPCRWRGGACTRALYGARCACCVARAQLSPPSASRQKIQSYDFYFLCSPRRRTRVRVASPASCEDCGLVCARRRPYIGTVMRLPRPCAERHCARLALAGLQAARATRSATAPPVEMQGRPESESVQNCACASGVFRLWRRY